MKNSEVLRAARDLLTPETWTKEAFARSKTGRKVHPNSPKAVRWDVYGALEKVSGELYGGVRASEAMRVATGEHIADINDSAQSVDEIHALFDKAIAAEEAAGR